MGCQPRRPGAFLRTLLSFRCISQWRSTLGVACGRCRGSLQNRLSKAGMAEDSEDNCPVKAAALEGGRRAQ